MVRPLIGDWTFEYEDGYGSGNIRRVKGEWIFRRILDGAGIEDLFICSSREMMEITPQPDEEYGVAIRMFDPAAKCYQMSYACERYLRRLTFRMDGEKLVGTVLDNPSRKWVFSEIGRDTFHWQNVTVLENGDWKVNSNVYARRKTE